MYVTHNSICVLLVIFHTKLLLYSISACSACLVNTKRVARVAMGIICITSVMFLLQKFYLF